VSNDVSNVLTTAPSAVADQTEKASAPIPSASGTQKPDFKNSNAVESIPETILPDFLENIDASNAAGDQVETNHVYDKTLAPSTPTVAEILGMHFPIPDQQIPSGQNQIGHPSSDVILHNGAITRNHFDEHVGEVTNGLANLKDLLQGSQYNLDMDTLSGLFGNHSDLLGLSSELNSNELDGNGTEQHQGFNIDAGAGSEMVPYNPCLFELAEEDSHFFEDSPNNFLDDELESMLTTEKSQLSDGRLKF